MMLKAKCNLLIMFFLFGFQMSPIGNQPINNEQFSVVLQKLRETTSELSLQQSVLLDLMIRNPTFRGNLALGYFIMRISEISSSSHIYILQLNAFDTALEKITREGVLKIPEKPTEFCCWKSISLVHAQVSYRTQEALKDEQIQNLNLQSPQIFHKIKSNLGNLSECLRYFDYYFANRK